MQREIHRIEASIHGVEPPPAVVARVEGADVMTDTVSDDHAVPQVVEKARQRRSCLLQRALEERHHRWPDFLRERMTVIRQPFLLVEGVLQHQDGVLSVKAERLQGIEGAASVDAHDFY